MPDPAPESALQACRTYADLNEHVMIGYHTNVYFGETDDQWHVTSFKHHNEQHDFDGRPWQYEVQVWYPNEKSSLENKRSIYTYDKCVTAEDAERRHVRYVQEIKAGTFGKDNDQ